jgi:hypothetical protein
VRSKTLAEMADSLEGLARDVRQMATEREDWTVVWNMVGSLIIHNGHGERVGLIDALNSRVELVGKDEPGET